MCQNHCKKHGLRASRNSGPDPADPAETQHPVRNRPWVPHVGGQDYGSLHKLPQIILTQECVFIAIWDLVAFVV